MKKGFKFYALCWAILFVLFNVICFATPSELKGYSKFAGAFFCGYGFITAAFIGQLVCAYITFKTENLKKLFYNLPLVRISYTGLCLTVVFGALCMAVPDLPNWIGIIVCLLILSFNIIAIIKAKLAAETVGEIDENVKAKTMFTTELTLQAQNILTDAKTDTQKQSVKKVFDAMRYSDPVSDNELFDVETNIKMMMNRLSTSVKNNDEENVVSLSNSITELIKQRNAICKAYKK